MMNEKLNMKYIRERNKIIKIVRRKLEQWYKYTILIEELEKQIKELVLGLEESQKSDNAIAIYYTGRGKYDYQAIVEMLNVPKSLVQKYSKVIIDYKKICEELNVPEDVMKQFYSKSDPYVSIRKRNKKDGEENDE